MSQYWTVHMGRRDHLNEGCSYAFPTSVAADFFALNHKRRDRDRYVAVETPDGVTTEIPWIAGEHWKRNFEAESKLSEPERKQAQERAMQFIAAEVARMRQEMTK